MYGQRNWKYHFLSHCHLMRKVFYIYFLLFGWLFFLLPLFNGIKNAAVATEQSEKIEMEWETIKVDVDIVQIASIFNSVIIELNESRHTLAGSPNSDSKKKKWKTSTGRKKAKLSRSLHMLSSIWQFVTVNRLSVLTFGILYER